MLDKFKQAKQLHQLQKELQKEKIEAEKQGVRVVMNGKMEIEEVSLNQELDQGAQERALKDALNDAMRKVQMAAAQKMQGMGGM